MYFYNSNKFWIIYYVRAYIWEIKILISEKNLHGKKFIISLNAVIVSFRKMLIYRKYRLYFREMSRVWKVRDRKEIKIIIKDEMCKICTASRRN